MTAFPTAESNGLRPAIAYGQLGILLELLWRGEETIFAKCDFCQTLNHRFALRCEACSGKLPAAYGTARSYAQDAVPAAIVRAPARHRRRELANVLIWVLAMPTLLFIFFGLWQLSWLNGLHAATPAPTRVATVASRSAASSAVVAASAPVAAASLAFADPQPPGAEWSQAPGRETAGATPAGRRADGRESPGASAPAARHDRLAAWRTESDPTAGCESRMFLLRAICLNQRCAQAQNARHPRCVAIVRQRMIDEARRNPTLVG
jgi:hypothetical protein